MIRVLRIIEYVYTDAETAEKDMNNWKAPAIGTIPSTGDKKQIKSTIITDLNFVPNGWDNPDADPVQDIKDELQKGFERGI